MEVSIREKSSIYNFNKYIVDKRNTSSKRAYVLYLIAIIIGLLIFIFPLLVNSESENNDNDRLIALTNIERAKYNLEPLVLNETLKELAQIRINDMVYYNYFAHTSPNGKKFRQFLRATDYDFLIAGENLAIDFYSNEKLISAWMASESHKKNMINPTFSDIAIVYQNVLIDDKLRPLAVMILGKELQK